ncbi:hypothetical protein [Leptolyngbya sp. NIES-2104]|uniref:hypothetical protein n=1 Tax=Leptolyngbya sp. NIES-2104 TaxID=1552121 RepID=UPI0006EC6D14|nr:hypothetical protein [Leptolyngbya sp. NIES-2104]GAP98118.1 hypothetical protein NIES2104_46710 [Leptolyngbya sp. NIES-2104]
MDNQRLDPAIAQVILNALPEHIRKAYLAHAAEIEYPVEAVIEMALAGFLDSEALSFVDCKPAAYDVAQA